MEDRMEIFEVHITADNTIHEVAKKFEVKTISVDLLAPDGSLLRTEHMTSVVLKHKSYLDCLKHVVELVNNMEIFCVVVERIKIECPPYEHYIKDSLYMESHFDADGWDYPVSRNQKKTVTLATDREYNQERYAEFRQKHTGRDLELCLFDSNHQEDLDWLQLYRAWNSAST
jgi:hypothetical protein